MTGDLGIIRYPKRALQLKDYSGLIYHDAITPSDIDGAFEIENRMFCFIEYKFGDAAMPRGQEMFLERLCDALEKSAKYPIVIEATHNHPPNEAIDCANALVTRYRWKFKWHAVKSTGKTVRSVLDKVYHHVFHEPF